MSASEQRALGESAAGSSASFERLLRHAPFGIVTLTDTGSIVGINDIGCALLAKKRQELIGAFLGQLFADSAAKVVAGLLEEAIAEGAAQSLEDMAYAPAPYVWQYFRLSVTHLAVDTNIVVLNDTTEARRAREQLENFKLELEEQVMSRTFELETKNKELTQFAYIASHDLQEPLRTLRSFVTLLEDELGPTLDEDSKQYLSFIGQSSQRMSSLVKGLMDYSRIGANREGQRIDCNALLKNVCDDLRTIQVESQAEIEIDILPHLVGFEPELHALFQNLIVNAIKFRHAERPPHVFISACRQQQHWQFSVRDNGIGIEEAHREKIFGIYQRIHSRQLYEGTGIGLAHCQKIVELHQGRIWVESELGTGSTFHFTLQNQPEGKAPCVDDLAQ